MEVAGWVLFTLGHKVRTKIQVCKALDSNPLLMFIVYYKYWFLTLQSSGPLKFWCAWLSLCHLGSIFPHSCLRGPLYVAHSQVFHMFYFPAGTSAFDFTDFFFLGVVGCILQKWLQYFCPHEFPEPFHSLSKKAGGQFMSPPGPRRAFVINALTNRIWQCRNICKARTKGDQLPCVFSLRALALEP